MRELKDYQIIQAVTVDLVRTSAPQLVTVKQYDNQVRVLQVNLVANGLAYEIPEGFVVRLRGTRPDGKGIMSDALVTEGNTAWFEITNVMTACAGRILCDVELSNADGAVVKTASLALNVQWSPLQEGTVEASETFPALQAALAKVQSIPEVDDTLTMSGQAADAKATGDAIDALTEEVANLPTDGSGLSSNAKNLLISVLRNAVYVSDQSANITALEASLATSEDGGEETEVTLIGISATYSGGDVPVGTAVANLTGIVVTATYSDGSTSTVTDYALSGEIVEGENTVTVSYSGKTTTFTVTGVVENGDSGDPGTVYYTISNSLTNVTTDNYAESVAENTAFTATLMADDGYELNTVTVTMGGVDITSSVYSDGVVTIESVTGNVVITATAMASSSGGDSCQYFLFLEQTLKRQPDVSFYAIRWRFFYDNGP